MNPEVGDAQTLTPTTNEELAIFLREASEANRPVSVLGGGSHQGYGSPAVSDLVIDMSGLADIETWDPDDMTITVGAGHSLADLEEVVRQRSLTAVMPEHPGASTVGGVVATGRSSLRRARLLGTRERMLEVTLVTGDGRVIRGGGRVVKNVSGFDLPRLAVGSFGSLGVIASVCLKLWPVPKASATVDVDQFAAADVVRRPLALLETNNSKRVYLWGTEAEVDASARKIGGRSQPGLVWPEDPSGEYRWSLRVPPASIEDAISAIPDGWDYLAIHGAGEIRAASVTDDGAGDLRAFAETLGGALVVVDAPPDNSFEPWGAPPPGVDIQRRLIAEFDPVRIINRGRLPGGL